MKNTLVIKKVFDRAHETQLNSVPADSLKITGELSEIFH